MTNENKEKKKQRYLNTVKQQELKEKNCKENSKAIVLKKGKESTHRKVVHKE